MKPAAEPIEKPRLGRREVAVGDADLLKAEFLPPALDRTCKRRPVCYP
jgi:hypothetical protein